VIIVQRNIERPAITKSLYFAISYCLLLCFSTYHSIDSSINYICAFPFFDTVADGFFY